jgi:nucleoside-diphosphate-sugar epimerase
MMERILVTGACGGMGCNLVRKLLHIGFGDALIIDPVEEISFTATIIKDNLQGLTD